VAEYPGETGYRRAVLPDALLHELSMLTRDVAAALAEIAALGLPEVLRQVPLATGELAAATQHTEAAAGTIMDACETLEAALADTPSSGLASALAARIYEACAFQDMVGQRLAKVAQTLRAIEAKTAGILRVCGPLSEYPDQWETMVLAGPQSHLSAMDQCAVDAMLAASG
jgi:chemotaxis regulatin CheY-phosphate phosphatase CheZ